MRRYFGIAVLTGLAGLLISTFSQLALFRIAGASWAQSLAIITATPGDYLFAFTSLVVAPLAETLFLPLVWWIVSKLGGSQRSCLAASSLFYFGLGWLAHGASIYSLGHAAGFLLLALLYGHIRSNFIPSKAYWIVAFSHFTWNLLALIVIGILTGRGILYPQKAQSHDSRIVQQAPSCGQASWSRA